MENTVRYVSKDKLQHILPYLSKDEIDDIVQTPEDTVFVGKLGDFTVDEDTGKLKSVWLETDYYNVNEGIHEWTVLFDPKDIYNQNFSDVSPDDNITEDILRDQLGSRDCVIFCHFEPMESSYIGTAKDINFCGFK